MATFGAAVTLVQRTNQHWKLVNKTLANGDPIASKEFKLRTLFGGTSGIDIRGDDGDAAKTLVNVLGTAANVAADKLLSIKDDASADLFYAQEDGDVYVKKDFTCDGVADFNGAGTSNFAGPVVFAGAVTFQATPTTVQSTQMNVSDQIIRCAYDQTGVPSLDGGLSVERGDSNNALCVFDESADEWVLAYTVDDTAAQVTFSSLADMRANEGNFEGGLILTNTGLTATGLDLGGSGSRLGTVYCATLDATSITGTIVSTGTNNLSWTVNEDADSATNEDAFLALKSGDGVAIPLSATLTYVNPDGTAANSYLTWDRKLDAQAGLKVSGGTVDVDVASDFSAAIAYSSTLTQSGSGQNTFTGNADFSAGVDVSGSALTSSAGLTLTSVGMTATGLDLGGSGTRLGTVYCDTLNATTIVGDTTMDGTDSNSFLINENAAATDAEDAWLSLLAGRGIGGTTIQEIRALFDHDANGAAGSYTGDFLFQYAADNLGAFTTTLKFGGGDGAITALTNLNAEAGFDVSGGALTFTGTAGSWTYAQSDSALTQAGAGQVTLSGNLDCSAGVDVSGSPLTSSAGLTLTNSGVTMTGLDLASSGNRAGVVYAATGNFSDVAPTTLEKPQSYRTMTNNSGVTIPKNSAVYVSGDDEVTMSDASAEATAKFMGVTLEEILNTASGDVAFAGANIAASKTALEAWSGGDSVYLSETAGELTNDVSGFATGAFVLKVGFAPVDKAAGSAGEMVIQPAAEAVENLSV